MQSTYTVLYSYLFCVCMCVCVCLYLMFFTLSHNFDIISVSSHPIEYLLYVVAMIWDVSCFVTWQRKHIFLYDAHSEVRSGKHGGMEEYNITYSVCVCVCVCVYLCIQHAKRKRCFMYPLVVCLLRTDTFALFRKRHDVLEKSYWIVLVRF